MRLKCVLIVEKQVNIAPTCTLCGESDLPLLKFYYAKNRKVRFCKSCWKNIMQKKDFANKTIKETTIEFSEYGNFAVQTNKKTHN